MNAKKNAHIELYRFFFAVTVVLFHLFSFFEIEPEWFHGGFLSVEFFFLVSGFFLAKSAGRLSKNADTKEAAAFFFGYIRSRFLRLYPLYLAALLSSLLARKLLKEPGFVGLRMWMRENYAEFLMLQWTGLGNEVLVSPLWFVPSLFFGGLLLVGLFALFRKHPGFFSLVICPLLFLTIYGYYFITIGKIDVIFSYHSVLRGIAGVALGWFLHGLLSLHAIDEWLKPPSKLCFVLAQIILLSLIVYENFAHRDRWNFPVIALFATGFSLLVKGNAKIPEKTAKVFCILGSLTYPIYVFHMPLFQAVGLLIHRM